MNRPVSLLIGAALVLAFATLSLIIVPAWQVSKLEVPPYLTDYSAQELRGKQEYIRQGCIYCHSQQPRSFGQTPADLAKGWGRASTPADYIFDKPHLLGTMRTGPDLFNVGARLPSQDWHLTHLYQPRAIFSWSLMPAYPYLFKVQNQAAAGEVVVKLPPELQPAGKVVVATPEALDLTAYLQALVRNYPVTNTENFLRDQGYDAQLKLQSEVGNE